MITSTVIKQWKMTTRRRELCLSWKDSSTDWVDLKDFKYYYSQYANNKKLTNNPRMYGG